ncbi:hypothetical protein [Tenacibaculum sp. 190524A05c]|uniref:hypothetical protein n=1 Tax=Tenacibaculum platacis TaxID=3137852 RepID=UPI0032B27756
MKKRNLFGIITLLLVLYSCSNSKLNKTDLTCGYENQKITIQIENGKEFLIYNQPTKTNFITTNIDPINLRIAGAGIRVLGTNKDKTGMRTEIKVLEDYIDNDTLNIKVWYTKDNQKTCDFKIPIKKVE